MSKRASISPDGVGGIREGTYAVGVDPPSRWLIIRRYRAIKDAALRSWWLPFFGVGYVALTLYASSRFLETSKRFLANDFFWSTFNATGGGLFVANAFNAMLIGVKDKREVSLADPMFTTSDRMDLPGATITFSAHYARMVQYDRLTGIEDAIHALRSLSASRAPLVITQYCWIDFDRQWSLAHTAERAERCQKWHAQNAAVYLESTLRNVPWGDFMQVYGQQFDVAIGNFLNETTAGRSFLETLAQGQQLSLADEAAYWRNKSIKHHKLQYHNAWQLGLDEKIEIVNALGIRSLFTIKKGDFGFTSTATTGAFNWALFDDLWAVVNNHTRISGLSLVRNASNFFGNHMSMEQVMQEDGVVPRDLGARDALVRAAIGPYGSVDAYWMPFPAAAFELVVDAQSVILNAIRASAAASEAYADISASADKIHYYPSWWLRPGRLYGGGSPLCRNVPSVGYVLQQFKFDDSCSSAVMDGGPIDRFAIVFATLVSGVVTATNAQDICGAAVVDAPACSAWFAKAVNFTQYIAPEDQSRLRRQAAAVHSALLVSNVSMMQYVIDAQADNSTRTSLLVDPVLAEDRSALWNAFGWVLVFGWVSGSREVVSFEGDNGVLTLISAYSAKMELQPNAAEVLQSMSIYPNAGVNFVTLILTIVAALVIIYAILMRFRVAGWNLTQFNRVAAIVWVGRPLLLLRGLVAICILSTSSPELVKEGVFSRVVDTPPSWFASILAAGESTWILYVAVDLLLMCTGGLTFAFAPMTHAIVWIIVAAMQLHQPVQHVMLVTPDCSYVQIDQQLSCRGGSIAVGSLSRLVTMLVIIAATIVVCYGVVRCVYRRREPMTDGLLLPGIAQEVFQRKYWVHDGDWFVDQASAVMAGLVTMPRRGAPTVVDIQAWSLLEGEEMPSNKAPEINGVDLQRALQLRRLQPKRNVKSV